MTFQRLPKGLRETDVDALSGLELEVVESLFSFTDDVSRTLVEELRKYFQKNPRTARYRWRGLLRDNGEVETSIDSAIHVSIDHPSQPKRWPYVMIRSVSADVMDLWLGQKEGTLIAPNPNYSQLDAAAAKASHDDYDEQPYIEVGERIGNQLNATVTLVVGAVGEGPRAECNAVSDLVIHGLVYPLRKALAARGLNWIPGRGRVDAEELVPIQGSERDKECMRTISFGLQVEWYDDFFYIADSVGDVNLERTYIEGIDPRK